MKIYEDHSEDESKKSKENSIGEKYPRKKNYKNRTYILLFQQLNDKTQLPI